MRVCMRGPQRRLPAARIQLAYGLRCFTMLAMRCAALRCGSPPHLGQQRRQRLLYRGVAEALSLQRLVQLYRAGLRGCCTAAAGRG